MSGSLSATTLAGAGLALSAVGTGVGVMGSLQTAAAQQASAKYQAQVAAGDQQIALQNASFAANSGEEQAAVQEQKTRTQEGEILASQASSGVDVNSTTASDVRTSEEKLGALDADTIRSNAARQAYGYQTQATNFENAESADVAQGENAETAGGIGAATSLFSGAGNASLNYAKIIGNASGVKTSDSINSVI